MKKYTTVPKLSKENGQVMALQVQSRYVRAQNRYCIVFGVLLIENVSIG